jgi:tetratricopeptide (TPR) repeat protein
MKKLLLTLTLLISFVSFGQTADEYFNRAFKKIQLSDDKGAIEDLTKGLEIDPNEFAYYLRGLGKNGLGDYSGAISDFTKAVEINPNYYKAYINRGNSKYKLKDYYGAISDYTKVLDNNPNDADTFINRGNTKKDLGDYSGAIVDYTKALVINPNYFNANFGRGIAKYKLKDYYGAIEDYTKVIELNPNSAAAYYNRSISKETLGDLNGACADRKKAAELGNTDAAGWVAKHCNRTNVTLVADSHDNLSFNDLKQISSKEIFLKTVIENGFQERHHPNSYLSYGYNLNTKIIPNTASIWSFFYKNKDFSFSFLRANTKSVKIYERIINDIQASCEFRVVRESPSYGTDIFYYSCPGSQKTEWLFYEGDDYNFIEIKEHFY